MMTPPGPQRVATADLRRGGPGTAVRAGGLRMRPADGATALAELAGHVDGLAAALRDPASAMGTAWRWGTALAEPLLAGRRLLVGGNGGSAAQAQHLTAELVGRYMAERVPLSAIALHADTSSLTAIGNDYGAEEVFARQIAAHGRPCDTVLLLSTSGRSPNILAAASRAAALGLRVWAMTGPAPNSLAHQADEAICVAADSTSIVQEAHLVAIHLLCEALDREVARR
jgi:phosphoheptose isomerase